MRYPPLPDLFLIVLCRVAEPPNLRQRAAGDGDETDPVPPRRETDSAARVIAAGGVAGSD